MKIISKYSKLSLPTKILIFMVIGVIVGIVFGEKATVLKPLGDLFIRLLMMAAIPLVFFNLLGGLASLEDIRIVSRLGIKIMAFYLSTVAIAMSIGIVFMHLIKPGIGMTLTAEVSEQVGSVPNIVQVILDLVPDNVFSAFSTGKVSQIVIFAVFLGIVTLLMPKEQKDMLRNVFITLADLFRKLVSVILHFSPIGIGALMADTIGRYGPRIFGPLAKFIGGVWLAQFIMALIYLLLLFLLTRTSPIEFLKKSGPLYATTVATCSSLASLVVSLDVAENRMKLPKSVYSFTLPLGAQLNKAGTAIMLAGVLMFTAQAAGVSFSLVSQISIVLIGLLLSEGSSGIPAGGLIIVMIFVKAFNLPLEIAAVVGGVFRLLDMSNTTLNCMGDLVGTVIVAKTEKLGELQ